MSEVTLRTGGPTELHRYRATTLLTMAVLSGYTTAIKTLPDGSRPDVLQLRPSSGGLFLGDAKATETPGNTETYDRLSRYAAFLQGWVQAGESGLMALSVAPTDAYGWLRVLRDLCVPLSGRIPVHGQVDHVDNVTTVVWHAFSGRIS